ncbi:MAG: hypothetical protein MZU97_10410 [Bacillus subtilis]|nr:hypothetical protein [Bacillus subtilis]
MQIADPSTSSEWTIDEYCRADPSRTTVAQYLADPEESSPRRRPTFDVKYRVDASAAPAVWIEERERAFEVRQERSTSSPRCARHRHQAGSPMTTIHETRHRSRPNRSSIQVSARRC